MNRFKIAAATVCVVLAAVSAYRLKQGPGLAQARNAISTGRDQPENRSTGSRNRPGGTRALLDSESAPVSNGLEIPARSVDEKGLVSPLRDGNFPVPSPPSPPSPISDSDILARGGVLTAMPALKDEEPPKGPRSIKSEDWKRQPNLLVNALRAGDRFEVDHDQLMSFLHGKDLLGWPEGSRNWIGDELMTALRQDMPDAAFADLKSIVENSSAPAAMRDYSIQHISHLVTSGTIGQEGVDFIWQTLAGNDPQTLGTALISLHRLSQQVPDWVPVAKVQAAADRLRGNPDERTRITANSIRLSH